MLHRKAAEYLSAGVTVVMVADYEAETVTLFYADKAVRTLNGEEELTLPEVLAGFRVPLEQLWE
jgi:Uma2 family endonuclease